MKFLLYNIKTIIALAIIIASTDSVFAKVSVEEVLDTATITNQIDYVLARSTTYDQYKVVKVVWINKLKKNVLDSLNSVKQHMVISDNKLKQKQSAIDSLLLSKNRIEDNLATIKLEKNSISFFGSMISKASYNSILFSVIFILLAALIFFIMLFLKTNKVASQTKIDLKEITNDYNNHRQRAREREEQMARRHLDEILKYKKQ